jgi:hypothetical protein
MVAGTLILLRLSPFELAENVPKVFHHKKSLKQKIMAVKKPKRIKGIRKIVQESKQVLKATNQINKFSRLSVFSLALFIVGFAIALSIDNIYLVPILAVGFALLPFLFILYSSSKYKKQLNEELESSLSTITTSYLRSENFLTAIKENLQYFNQPVHGVFERFLVRVNTIDPDIIAGIENMKKEIDNSVFEEWCEAAILCQKDHNLKSTLLPIVSKLSKMRTVTSNLEYEMYKPIRGYLSMLTIIAGIICIVSILNKEWSSYLFYTTPGKISISITALIILITLVRVIYLSKPIEYRR